MRARSCLTRRWSLPPAFTPTTTLSRWTMPGKWKSHLKRSEHTLTSTPRRLHSAHTSLLISALFVHANTMSDNEFDNYEKIFSSQQMISFLDYLNTPAEPRSGFGRMKEKLMADMKRRAVEKMSQGSSGK